MFNQLERKALENLIKHAKRNSGQAFRVADFLLCWWNAQSQGKFDFTEVWALDGDILEDVITVFVGFASRKGLYADQMGYERDFIEIIRLNR
jgi:hypothetical protein